MIKFIKDEINIAEYIGQYIELTGSEPNFKSICPFHNDTNPSLSISTDKRIFKCFSCGAGGDIFNFTMLYHKKSFREAIKILSEYLGIEDKQDPTDSYLLELTQECHNYFISHHTNDSLQFIEKTRQISFPVAGAFKVGFIPHVDIPDNIKKIVDKDKDVAWSTGMFNKFLNKFRFPGCLTFPFFDKGKPVGFSFMRINRTQDEAKYENSRTSRIFKRNELLFDSGKPLMDKDKVYLVEGYFDAMRLYQRGVFNVSAICGSYLHPLQLKKLSGYKEILLMFDGDKAGRETTIRTGTMVEQSGFEVYVHVLPYGYDPDTYYSINRLDTDPVPFIHYLFDEYKGDNLVDYVLSHVSKLKNLGLINTYIGRIHTLYPHIPTSLLASSYNEGYEDSKSNGSGFSIQAEIIKGAIQGLIDIESLMLDRFSSKYKNVLEDLMLISVSNDSIIIDDSNIDKFKDYLGPLLISIEELNKIVLSYSNDIEKLIQAKR